MPHVSGRRLRDARKRTPRNRDIQPDGTAWSCIEVPPGTECVSAEIIFGVIILPPPETYILVSASLPRLAARIILAARPSDFPSCWCSCSRASSPISACLDLARDAIRVSFALCACLRLPEHHHEEYRFAITRFEHERIAKRASD